MFDKMQSLLSTENRAKLQESLLEEYVEWEKEVNEPFTGKVKYTELDFYKKQRDFILWLFKRFDKELEWVDGHKEIVEKIESDLMQHRSAIAGFMGWDFDWKFSAHDVIRNKMKYTKHVIQRPVQVMEEEKKKKDAEIQPLNDETTAEDTTFME